MYVSDFASWPVLANLILAWQIFVPYPCVRLKFFLVSLILPNVVCWACFFLLVWRIFVPSPRVRLKFFFVSLMLPRPCKIFTSLANLCPSPLCYETSKIFVFPRSCKIYGAFYRFTWFFFMFPRFFQENSFSFTFSFIFIHCSTCFKFRTHLLLIFASHLRLT